jgi:hypothetical protein
MNKLILTAVLALGGVAMTTPSASAEIVFRIGFRPEPRVVVAPAPCVPQPCPPVVVAPAYYRPLPPPVVVVPARQVEYEHHHHWYHR